MLGAHFLRFGNYGATAACALAPLALFGRSLWIRRVYQLFMLFAGASWVYAAIGLVRARIGAGAPWLRLVFILGAVAALAWASAALFEIRRVKGRFSEEAGSWGLSLSTFLVTALSLVAVQLLVTPPMLLLERFLNGGGWLEVGVLPAYAAFVAGKFREAKNVALWRKRVWTLFSAVIFLQLLLGLSGLGRFLMSGHLHPPVPALIVASPIYKGGGFFMPALFAATLLLVGPAWCSHLCYIGSWDLLASTARGRPGDPPKWARWGRGATLLATVSAAIALRAAGVPGVLAAGLGVAFGLCGVAVMLHFSRRAGTMVHCIGFCPIGLLSAVFGRVSPFRINILPGCTDCGACTPACRYYALSKYDIAKRRPGFNCTLCGDCLARCQERQIEYRFLGLGASRARDLFILLAISSHSVFMGVAML